MEFSRCARAAPSVRSPSKLNSVNAPEVLLSGTSIEVDVVLGELGSPTAEAIKVLEKASDETNAVLHVTC